VIDEKTTKLNPVFDALFFCSVETVKKILNFKPTEEEVEVEINEEIEIKEEQ